MKVEEQTLKVYSFCGLLLLTILLSFPVPLHLSTRLIGGTADAWQFPWNNFVFRERLLAGKNPYYTNSIFFPVGTSLALHSYTEFDGTVGLLLSPFCNEIAQTNVAMLLATFLTAIGTYLLIFEITSNSVASLFGAIAFAFCPFRMVRMLGQMNFALTQWIPFAIFSFLRLMKTRRTLYALLLAIFFTLTHYSNQYFSVYLILVLITLLISGLFVFPEWRSAIVIRNLLLASLLAMIGLIPPLLSYYNDYQEKTLFELQPKKLAIKTSVAPLEYFFVDTMNPWLASRLPEALQKETRGRVSPGVLSLYGGIIGAFLAIRRRQKTVLLFAPVAILFMVLSLGPEIQFGDHIAPLPFALLLKIPFLSHVRLPPRFAVIVALCTAIFAAYGVSILLRQTWQNRLLIASLFTALIFELCPVPVLTQEMNTSPAFYKIKQQPGSTMLTVPYSFDATASNQLKHQMVHKQNMLNGRISRNPLEQVGFFSEIPVARIFYRLSLRNTMLKHFNDDLEYANLFRSLFRVRYVAVFPPTNSIPGLEPAILQLFPDARLLSKENGILVYDLPVIHQQMYEFNGADPGMKFFLYSNWKLERRFDPAEKEARLLMPQIENGQKLLLTLRWNRQPDAGTIRLQIGKNLLQELPASNNRGKMQVLLTDHQLEQAHQLISVSFDSPEKVELRSLKIEIN